MRLTSMKKVCCCTLYALATGAGGRGGEVRQATQYVWCRNCGVWLTGHDQAHHHCRSRHYPPHPPIYVPRYCVVHLPYWVSMLIISSCLVVLGPGS